MANTASEAVRVTLLKPRRPLLRFDVAPFAVIYALLHAHAWASLAYGTISYETLACIPVALAFHLLLFLTSLGFLMFHVQLLYTIPCGLRLLL